jgi:hypothetical protein
VLFDPIGHFLVAGDTRCHEQVPCAKQFSAHSKGLAAFAAAAGADDQYGAMHRILCALQPFGWGVIQLKALYPQGLSYMISWYLAMIFEKTRTGSTIGLLQFNTTIMVI